MEQEISKLLSVLRRIARATRYIEWTKPGPDATQFCVAQYNRILSRLTVIEPSVGPLFPPLADTASPKVIRMACRDLYAYFEVEEECALPIPPVPPLPPIINFGCRPRSRRRRRWAPFVVRCD
ncbi:MAG TPA: hypothetical protein VK893_13135 [Pyrinomonadaceae bacterium]|nr:hypothetical protein [Pyrinomonadaceae bacterium]